MLINVWQEACLYSSNHGRLPHLRWYYFIRICSVIRLSWSVDTRSSHHRNDRSLYWSKRWIWYSQYRKYDRSKWAFHNLFELQIDVQQRSAFRAYTLDPLSSLLYSLHSIQNIPVPIWHIHHDKNLVLLLAIQHHSKA